MKAYLGPPLRDARVGELVAIDIELFGAEEKRLHRPDEGEFASMAIAMSDGAYLVERKEDVNEALRRIRHGLWTLHQSVFDLRHLRRWSNIRPARVWDTLLVERDLFGGWYDRFSLADVGRRWLGIYMEKDTRDHFTTADEMTNAMREYNLKDALITRAVAEKQMEYAPSNFPWYWEIDEPLIWVVLDMPGVRVDRERWMELAVRNQERYDEILMELGFNPRSPQQVKEYIKGAFGVSLRNTAEATLKKAMKKSPKTAEVIGRILEARGAGKNASTYGEKWLAKAEGEYVYPDWRIVGAETGRTSCKNPNLQQIPIRKTPEYRDTIIASEGNRLIVSDVSQQEIRILSYFSRDPILMRILEEGGDTHLETAKLIYEDPYLTHDDPERRVGKDINLGLSYGLTAAGLARNTGITTARAEILLNKYFSTFVGVKRLHGRLLQDAASRLYVETASGRPVWVNPYSKQWENNARNSPIQGTGGDHMKLAAVLTHRKTAEAGIPFTLNLLVHDELVCDTPEGYVERTAEVTHKAWVEAADYLMPGLPMKIDSAVGDNWGCKK